MRKTNTNLPSRKRIFDFIVAYKRGNDGLSPTRREIVEQVGISSTSVVNFHLDVLEKDGKIRLHKARENRGIMVVGGEWQWHEEYLEPVDNL